MKFSYSKSMFTIQAMALLAILLGIIFIMSRGGIGNAWLIVFAGIFILAILIVQVSPMFTQHEVNSEGIRLSHGLIFNSWFPYGHIESVEIYSMNTGIFGPFSTRSRIVLASGNNGLVKIKLAHRKRFGMLLLRKADEIIIDLEKPGEFVKLANEELSDLNNNSKI